MGMGVVVALMLVGIIIGFLIGTRARQLVAIGKVLPDAIRSFTIRIPPRREPEEAADEGGGDDDQLDEEAAGAGAFLEDFLNAEGDSGWDDHPDLFVNPVLLHQIRLFKDQQKLEKALEQRRAALEAEGLDPEIIEKKLLEDDDEGPAGPKSDKPCALNVLIAAGACVTPMAGGGGAEAIAAEERRRQTRNVDVYLRTALNVSTDKAKANTRNAKGVKVSSAMEVAQQTGLVRHGAGTFLRVVRNVPVAKAGRDVLRKWKTERDYQKQRRGEEDPEHWDEPSDGEQESRKSVDAGRRRQHGGAALNQAELMKLAAELGQEVEFDEEQEGFEQDDIDQDPP